MLKRVDRVQIVVPNRTVAEDTAAAIFGAELVRRDQIAHLAAKRSLMQVGSGMIEFLEPAGAGAVADFMTQARGGLFAAGFSVADIDQAAAHLKHSKVEFVNEGGQLYIGERATCGMRVVLSTFHERAPVGAIRWLYEVTNVVNDWRAAADLYARIFALDSSKFVPLTSPEFGYTGALTMFDAPARLDRIELSQITRPELAMGRFHARRGESLYMFYVETDDVVEIANRLRAREGRFEMRRAGFGQGLWIHPSAFCGVLVGVSKTNLAWRWSGDPSRAPAA